MSKLQEKANRIVDGALSTFTKAIEEVEKANHLLTNAVASDEDRLHKITKSIEDSYRQLDVVQAEKMNKEAEIIQNKELIAKLERFTK